VLHFSNSRGKLAPFIPQLSSEYSTSKEGNKDTVIGGAVSPPPPVSVLQIVESVPPQRLNRNPAIVVILLKITKQSIHCCIYISTNSNQGTNILLCV
jgi:hypothetical protein